MSSSLVVAPVWKWVHLFGPGSKIVLFANFHQFQIRIFTFDLIFGPETFVLSIFWRVTAQIRIERATQICFNFLDSSTGLVLTPHESWVPFLFPDRVSMWIPTARVELCMMRSTQWSLDKETLNIHLHSSGRVAFNTSPSIKKHEMHWQPSRPKCNY